MEFRSKPAGVLKRPFHGTCATQCVAGTQDSTTHVPEHLALKFDSDTAHQTSFAVSSVPQWSGAADGVRLGFRFSTHGALTIIDQSQCQPLQSTFRQSKCSAASKCLKCHMQKLPAWLTFGPTCMHEMERSDWQKPTEVCVNIELRRPRGQV